MAASDRGCKTCAFFSPCSLKQEGEMAHNWVRPVPGISPCPRLQKARAFLRVRYRKIWYDRATFSLSSREERKKNFAIIQGHFLAVYTYSPNVLIPAKSMEAFSVSGRIVNSSTKRREEQIGCLQLHYSLFSCSASFIARPCKWFFFLSYAGRV